MFNLCKNPLHVVNIGLGSFKDNLLHAGFDCTQLQWSPPALGNKEAGWELANLINNPLIEEANRIAFERYLNANPVLTAIDLAKNLLPEMHGGKKLILHSGPPISWNEMCGPQQGAILGAILFEGWAGDLKQAEELVLDGLVKLDCCHHHNAVGPMAGIISPSMPLWVVKNTTHGNYAYSNLNEGLGQVLRFGANNEAVIERLKWMTTVLMPVLNLALQKNGHLDLKPIIAQALHMGDEVHNRNAAATAQLFKKLVLNLLDSPLEAKLISESLSFIAGNDHFFLNISMAACKAMLDAAKNVKHSSMVVAMARNGVDFGIRLSGTGDQWFSAPANTINGLFFPGYSQDDANPDLGDSSITETAGLGGFAMAASPAIVKFVGGNSDDALQNSIRMRYITIGNQPGFTLPGLNFAGTAAGIDARKVVDRGILPIINTGIAHKKAGVGQIGAGITTAPMQCFILAIHALAADLNFNVK